MVIHLLDKFACPNKVKKCSWKHKHEDEKPLKVETNLTLHKDTNFLW